MRCTAARRPLGESATCWECAGCADGAGTATVAADPDEIVLAAAARREDERPFVGRGERAA